MMNGESLVPRRYGVYLVQEYGSASGIKRVLGHILRQGDVDNANLLKITKEESLRHTNILEPLLDDVVSKASSILTELRPELSEVMWKYLYLPVVPLGVEKPALQEAFRLSRDLAKHVKPSLKQRLLPAYMLERGGIGLGTNVINITSSYVLITLHGSFPDGSIVKPKSIPERRELLKLVRELRKKDYLIPEEGNSPLPVLGAVLLKPVKEVLNELSSFISSWFKDNYVSLLKLSEEIAANHSSRTFAWDAFFYLTHVVVALVTYGLVRRKTLPFPDPCVGVLELLPL